MSAVIARLGNGTFGIQADTCVFIFCTEQEATNWLNGSDDPITCPLCLGHGATSIQSQRTGYALYGAECIACHNAGNVVPKYSRHRLTQL